MEQARTTAAQAFKDLQTSAADEKEQKLEAIRDALLSHPLLAEEFASDLKKLSETVEKGQQWVCDTYGAVAEHTSSPAVHTVGLEVATILLSVPNTARHALQCISSSIRAFYRDASLRFQDDGLFKAFHAASDAVCETADAGSLSIRLPAVKLMESILLILTSAVSSKLGLPPKEVAVKVQGYLRRLLAWLKPAKGKERSGTLMIVAIQVAATLALQRPGQAGRVLPTMLSLASAVATDAEAGASSIRKLLRKTLFTVLQATSSPLQTWKAKVKDALQTLGVDFGDKPAQDAKQMQQPAKDPADPRLLQSQQPTGTAGPAAHTTLPHQLPPPQNIAALLPGGIEDSTPQAEIDQVVAIVAALLADNDQPTCIAFVNGLPPAVLADVVVSNMAHLPSKEDVMGSEPQGPGHRSGNALLEGLMKATADGAAAPHQVSQTPPQGVVLPSFAPQPAASGPPAVSSNQAAPKQETVAAAAKPASRAVAPPAAVRLQPVQMGEAQQAAARRGGLQRLVEAAALPCQQLRAGLLSHLAPHMLEDGWMDVLLQHIVQTKDRGGYDLAVDWLFAVFAATSTAPAAEERNTQPGNDEPAVATSATPNATTGRLPQLSTAYTECLQTIIQAFRTQLQAKDRTIARILLDAPALPDQLLKDLLQGLLGQGGEHATLALIAARDVVMMRPANRPQALQAMLEAAVMDDREIRLKAVRLIANKLFSEAMLTERIEEFATAELRKLCVPRSGKRQRPDSDTPAQPLQPDKRQRLEAASQSTGQPADKAAGEPANQPADEPAGQPANQQADQAEDQAEDQSSEMKGSPRKSQGAASTDHLTANGHKDSRLPGESEDGREARAADSAVNTDTSFSSVGAPQPTEKGAGDPQAVQQKGGQPLDRRKTAEALDSAADAGSPAGAGRQPPETPEAAARHCELYCALCTKRHALLRGLFTAYAASGEGGRAAVLKNADGLARVLGPQAPTLIALIDNTPPGALSLLVRMLFFLTESQPAPQVLVEACLRHFQRTQNPATLPAALAGMPKEQIVGLLPKLLEPAALFSQCLSRILLPLPTGRGSMTPTEVLLALHSIDPSKDGVKLKAVMGALDHCVGQRKAFDKAALASALQQLTQRPTLPPLYMRFLMQAQAAVPDLKGFAIEQLAALVNRQIWTNKTLFTGWNLAVRQNVPESFPAFLQLPTRVLTETLQSAPEEFREKLKQYANSPACPANQRNPIMRLLEGVEKK